MLYRIISLLAVFFSSSISSTAHTQRWGSPSAQTNHSVWSNATHMWTFGVYAFMWYIMYKTIVASNRQAILLLLLFIFFCFVSFITKVQSFKVWICVKKTGTHIDTAPETATIAMGSPYGRKFGLILKFIHTEQYHHRSNTQASTQRNSWMP